MLKCSNCAAPLPQGAPGTTIECRFCHVETRVPEPNAPQVVVQYGKPYAKPPSFNPAFLVVPVVLFGLLLTLGTVFWSVLRSVPKVSMPAIPFTPPTPPAFRFGGAEKGAVSPSQIPSLVEKDSIGWTELTAPGMVGTFASFDPTANVAWAVGIARNWSNDAELESVYLTGVRPDGTMDLGARDDHNADYRFISKSLEAAQEKMKEVSEKKLVLEFRVMVQAGKVTFLGSKPLSHRKAEVGPVPPTFGCGMPKVLELARSSGLAPRPFYSLMARYQDYKKSWGWYVNGKDTTANRRIATDASCKLL